MPRSPEWFQQVPAAIEALQSFPAPVVDRAGLELLLQVSRRHAIRLLHAFGGTQAGRTFLIAKQDLIAALEAVQAGETCDAELRRRQRLSADLERTRGDLKARKVKLPVAPDSGPGSSLPSGMRLARPGVLEVEFSSAEDLLGRLYELVRIASKDLEAFEAVLGGAERGA